MELSQLIYFQKSAELHSISKAAETMHVSQPTVSIAIKKLEDELGLPVFDHTKKPLSLTGFGKQLLTRVDSIMFEIKNIRLEATDYMENKKVKVRLGLPLTLCNELIYYLKKDFCSENPNIDLFLFQYGTEEISRKVAAEELDIGITCIPDSSHLHYTNLKEVEFYAYLSPESELAGYDHLTPQLLSGQNLLITDTTISEIEQNIIRYLRKENVTGNYTNSGILFPESSLILAELKEGIALLSKHATMGNIKVLKKPIVPPLKIPLCIIWNKNLYLSSSHKKLISFIKKSDFIFD